MQQSNTKPLQQTYHTTQTHLKSYVFLLCSFCWILPRGICIRCYNLLVAKYVTHPFVFSENPTQSLHQQRRSVHQCSEDVSMDCTMQQPSVSSAHSLRPERPRTLVSLFWKLIGRCDAQGEGARSFHLPPHSLPPCTRHPHWPVCRVTIVKQKAHAAHGTLYTFFPPSIYEWRISHVSDDEGENTPFEISTLHDQNYCFHTKFWQTNPS